MVYDWFPEKYTGHKPWCVRPDQHSVYLSDCSGQQGQLSEAWKEDHYGHPWAQPDSTPKPKPTTFDVPITPTFRAPDTIKRVRTQLQAAYDRAHDITAGHSVNIPDHAEWIKQEVRYAAALLGIILREQ